jgi:glycosyltransferase A (GT-A) superfamily protein (DUF2064 family)
MSTADPAVLLMPPAGGPEPVAGLTAALEAEAERWAGLVAGDAVYRVRAPLADATASVLSERAGPLLVVWPVLARLRAEHASAALEDLASGADLVLGPVIDGGLYLLGLPRPLGELIDLSEETWSGAEAMPVALAAASDARLEVGMLRAERALRRPTDVRAALADPLTPEPLVALMSGG